MKSIIDKIHAFFFEEDRTNHDFIAFFRVAIGSIVLLHFISVWKDFGLLFGKSGIVPWDIPDVMVPEYILTVPKIMVFLERFGMTEGTSILIIQLTFCTLCIALIVGVFTRLSALLLLLLQIAIVKGASFYSYGADFFTSMSLFYLIIFPATSFLNTNKKKILPNLTPYRRLFQLHVSVAYFFSGFGKVLGFNWWNGESIWKAINLPYANKDFDFDFDWLIDHSWIFVAIGWGTIMLEMLYPIFVWIGFTRKTWIWLVISMHVGIAIVLNLYFFSAIMIIWNLTAFYITEDQHLVSQKRDDIKESIPIESKQSQLT